LVHQNTATADAGSTVGQEDFWTDALQLRDYETALKRENIKPAALLDQLIPRIFQAGKSIEILARLDQLIRVDAENNRPLNAHAQLYDELLANIRARLPPRPALATETAKCGGLKSANEKSANEKSASENAAQESRGQENRFREIIQAAGDDEYLARAFGSMFVSVGLLTVEGRPAAEEEEIKQNYMLEDCLLDPLR
jgi:hypothetical protein